jgi:hypothetical protein
MEIFSFIFEPPRLRPASINFILKFAQGLSHPAFKEEGGEFSYFSFYLDFKICSGTNFSSWSGVCQPERFHSGGNEWIFVVLKCAIGAKYG